jgi:RES domain-containing protein
VIYAADTYAGALLEKLVHTNIGRIPASQAYIEILIPEDLEIEEVTPADLPGWDAEDQQVSREYGDAWHDQQRTAVLVAPSLLTPVERNIVINQDHPDFAKIRASTPKPVRWDARLFGR